MRTAVCLLIALAACASPPGSTPSGDAPESEVSPTAVSTTDDPPSTDDTTSSVEPDSTACGGTVARVESFEYRTIDGVEPNLLSLDVHSPAASTSCPVLIWVHGGSWQAGDKSTRATGGKADHFVAEGYVFVSVNYRLVEASNDVRWPDFGNDVAAAVAWVIDEAAALGVDPERVALVGHSAGAHLVSIVGTNPDLLAAVGRERSDLACVVSLDSVTHDLTDQPTFERDIVRAAFGDDAGVLADGSPTLQAIEHADDGSVPEFLIVTRGRDVRLRSAARLGTALLDAGASASVYDASPYDHRDVNVRIGEPGESKITPAVTEFLADCVA